tara:strand:+ start:683 stop:937 length:255 start_codon:yes stop_codon:yes gene_type:complete
MSQNKSENKFAGMKNSLDITSGSTNKFIGVAQGTTVQGNMYGKVGVGIPIMKKDNFSIGASVSRGIGRFQPSNPTYTLGAKWNF